jgi:hypothetical protein
LRGDAGFAAVAAQLWLEGAGRIASSKEQDGRLARVARAAGCPEAHALYRRALGVEPARARAVVPLLRRLDEKAAVVYRLLATLPPEEPSRRLESRVWGAYLSHLIGTLALVPGRGHPAYLYQSLQAIRHWTTEYPAWKIIPLRRENEAGAEHLSRRADELADLAERIRTVLLDPARATDRAQACLTAADQLLHLTETRL